MMNSIHANGVSKVVRLACWLAVCLVLALLVLGTLITTYRVGMVDPIWPTEPWFLLSQDWKEPSPGYFIEHIHRVAGYLSGFAILGMVILTWNTTGGTFRKGMTNAGLVAVSVGVAIAMTSVDRSKAAADPVGAVNQKVLGIGLGIALASALVSIARAITSIKKNEPNAGLRMLALLAYLGVILQGLLGGLRVYLNALVGPELATVHGASGQLVFCLVFGTALLASSPAIIPALESKDLRLLPKIGWMLFCVLVVQLVWAVIVRHGGARWAQRMHLITAFIAFGVVAWISLKMTQSGRARSYLKPYTILLGAIVFVQVVLGVEAWMGKFGTGRPVIQEATTFGQATVRTLHAMVGAILLVVSFGAAIRIQQAKRAEVQAS